MTELHFFAAGVVGAIAAAHVSDGGIIIPSIQAVKNGHGKKIALGGLIGLAAGGLAGIYADNSLWNAACWGFAGAKLIEQGGTKIIERLSGGEINGTRKMVEEGKGQGRETR